MISTNTLAEPRIGCSSCMARVPLARSVYLDGLVRIFTCPRCHATYPVLRSGGEPR